MKVSNARADDFATSPDPKARAVLVYGADAGLVNERVASLIASVLEDPTDPFRLSRLPADDVLKDPARLSDEAAALSLVGGRRVVLVEDAGDTLAPLLEDWLEHALGDALVVIKAGELAQRSKLRKLFESAAEAAALACYRDEDAGLGRVIRAHLSDAGFEVSSDALGFLEAHLGGDRQVTRRELEKLMLYKTGHGTRVELDDAEACVGDSRLVTLDDLAFAVGAGDLAALERRLNRCYQEGQNPIAVVRAVTRHFQRLHLVAGLVDQGQPLGDALKRLRPPVFWKVAEPFKAQCRGWSQERLGRILGDLVGTEIACKETGQPSELLVARTLLSIAANAPRAARH